MKELNGHKVNEVNDGLVVAVLDGPGPGGASHDYEIRHTETDPSKSFVFGLRFQKGGLNEAGVNGLTHEALLDVLIDRLEGFQSGPFACADNAQALGFLKCAQIALKKRTEARVARGVEGSHKV